MTAIFTAISFFALALSFGFLAFRFLSDTVYLALAGREFFEIVRGLMAAIGAAVIAEQIITNVIAYLKGVIRNYVGGGVKS